jgi:hypothetical protein
MRTRGCAADRCQTAPVPSRWSDFSLKARSKRLSIGDGAFRPGRVACDPFCATLSYPPLPDFRWTKTAAEPALCAIKTNPRALLNHSTVPVGKCTPAARRFRSSGAAYRAVSRLRVGLKTRVRLWSDHRTAAKYVPNTTKTRTVAAIKHMISSGLIARAELQHS